MYFIPKCVLILIIIRVTICIRRGKNYISHLFFRLIQALEMSRFFAANSDTESSSSSSESEDEQGFTGPTGPQFLVSFIQTCIKFWARQVLDSATVINVNMLKPPKAKIHSTECCIDERR